MIDLDDRTVTAFGNCLAVALESPDASQRAWAYAVLRRFGYVVVSKATAIAVGRIIRREDFGLPMSVRELRDASYAIATSPSFDSDTE